MRFEKVKGRQVLDASEDMILTKHPELAYARIKSHGPSVIRGGRHVTNVGKLGVRECVRASFWALRFIWTER